MKTVGKHCLRAADADLLSKETRLRKPSVTSLVSHWAALESNSHFSMEPPKTFPGLVRKYITRIRPELEKVDYVDAYLCRREDLRKNFPKGRRQSPQGNISRCWSPGRESTSEKITSTSISSLEMGKF